MWLKDKMYHALVEKHSGIKVAYQGYVTENPERHQKQRLRSWLLLLVLNMQYYILGHVRTPSKTSTDGNHLKYPEYEIENRIPIDELVEYLSKFDVISFDIFDTLLFRAVADPKDLFIVVGNRLKVMNFKNIRVTAEMEARENSLKPYQEINIDDIYEIVHTKCGVDKEKAIGVEIQAEKDLCFANPYMLEVYQKLLKKGKKIVAVSNMYLPRAVIAELLCRNGYQELQDIFVSCEYLCSKHKGHLQKKVTEIIGKNKTYIHVGDNYNADFVGSRMAGWKSFYYKGVNEIGRPYRPANMSKLGGALYSGLVNAKLHNGADKINKYYEFGYAYGGILACGYCSWLNRYVKENDVDKLLFSGRDMYIVHEIYNKYYKKVDNSYILLSRYAAQRFSFKQFSDYFIAAHVYSRARIGKLTIKEMLEEIGLSILIPYLKEYNLSHLDLFTTDNYSSIKKCIYDKKELILKAFEPEKNAALAYYVPFVKGKRNVAVVDLGWQGTNALCLKHLLEEHFDNNINVSSLLMCATGGEFLDPLISNGVTNAFCFSPQMNPNLQSQFQTATSLGRFPCELLFTSVEDSLKSFCFDENGNVYPTFLPPERRNIQMITEIFRGIREFVDDYHRLGITEDDLMFSGFEAILPLNKLTYNKTYILDILSKFENSPWLGELTNRDAAQY